MRQRKGMIYNRGPLSPSATTEHNVPGATVAFLDSGGMATTTI